MPLSSSCSAGSKSLSNTSTALVSSETSRAWEKEKKHNKWQIKSERWRPALSKPYSFQWTWAITQNPYKERETQDFWVNLRIYCIKLKHMHGSVALNIKEDFDYEEKASQSGFPRPAEEPRKLTTMLEEWGYKLAEWSNTDPQRQDQFQRAKTGRFIIQALRKRTTKHDIHFRDKCSAVVFFHNCQSEPEAIYFWLLPSGKVRLTSGTVFVISATNDVRLCPNGAWRKTE